MPIRPVAVSRLQSPEAVAQFTIGGVNYNEILKLRVHRDVQEQTGEGEVTLSWPGAPAAAGEIAMPAFMDGADGSIYLDHQLAMTFRFDTRTSHGSPTQYELELHFRGLSADMVDGAPDHETGEEVNKTVGQIMQKLVQGYSAKFIDKSGESRTIPRFVIAQGESVAGAMRRASREFSLNFFENEAGQLVLQNKDDTEGTGGPLKLGDRKITHWSVKRDYGPRAGEYRVYATGLPNEDKGIWGKAALQSSVAKGVSQFLGFQKLRVYLADGDHDQESIKTRAGYEGSRSSAQGLNVTLRVSTWTDVDGILWKLLREYPVEIPVDGVNETLMLSAVTFFLTPTERYATLVLTSQKTFGRSGPLYGTGASSMTETFDIRVKDGKVVPDEKKKKEEKPKPEPPPP